MLIKNFRRVGFAPGLSRICIFKSLNLSKSFCVLPENKTDKEKENSNTFNAESFRFKYQDLLPSPNVRWRNVIREKLERRDMLRRRAVINIPEFYVGSILAVTTSNEHASAKMTRFVGICIMKYSEGLRSNFLLRNIIDNHGIEVLYSLYSPLIQKIEVLRLEKRLDNKLFYLRDAPNEYSTFPFDMQAEYRDENAPVPINQTKVKLNPRPWLQRYERMNLKGAILPELPEIFYKKAQKVAKPWEKYDLMDQYRHTIPEEDQKDILSEISDELKRLEAKHKIEKRKRTFDKIKKTTPLVF